MYVSNAKINIANSNINESVWKTLIDCETFLKIIPCSHGPHLAREKTATALKTSYLIYYTRKLSDAEVKEWFALNEKRMIKIFTELGRIYYC